MRVYNIKSEKPHSDVRQTAELIVVQPLTQNQHHTNAENIQNSTSFIENAQLSSTKNQNQNDSRNQLGNSEITSEKEINSINHLRAGKRKHLSLSLNRQYGGEIKSLKLIEKDTDYCGALKENQNCNQIRNVKSETKARKVLSLKKQFSEYRPRFVLQKEAKKCRAAGLRNFDHLFTSNNINNNNNNNNNNNINNNNNNNNHYQVNGIKRIEEDLKVALPLTTSISIEVEAAEKRQTKRKVSFEETITAAKVPRKMSMYDYTNHQTTQSATSAGEYLTSKVIHANNTDDGMHSDNKQYMNALATSMATLSNIGNTCYLNSVVYTLRFAPLFLHNLHHLIEDLSQINQKVCQNKAKSSSLGRNIGGLQGSNTRSWSTKDLASVGNSDVPKTPRQIATEKLHELFHNLHRNEMIETIEGFHADTFLNAVQDVSSIFGGNQQQDAHEFLMCVLDSIRETCQSLTKVVSDCPDILMNGYVSLPEKNEVQPTQQIPIVKSLTFFRKRNKEDKPKNNRLNSPMKECDTVDTTSTNSNSSVGKQQNANANCTINTGVDPTTEFHDKCKISEKIKKLGFDFFAEDFEGVTVSSTKCLSCETVTEQEETMIDISVPITGIENIERETFDNQQFIQNLCITREQFRSENKYRCEVCIGLTEAIRTVKYKKLPRLLIIQLKRFSGGMEKINSYIPTPFTMQCFCAKCCDLPDKDKLHIYKLYSVITHVGATLSVGHYIAYTCSLDGYSEYINCPKDRRKLQQQQQQQQGTGHSGSSMSSSKDDGKNASIVKKMMFGRSKASSSGDVTKNLNGFGKGMANGIDKLHNNSSCQSLNCCGIYMKNGLIGPNNGSINLTNGISDYSSSSTSSSSRSNNNAFNDNLVNSSSTDMGYTHSNSNSTSTAGNIHSNSSRHQPDPIWHMCDDDKIKAMSQTEFKELLSPNSKKIMITPYLLFYARADVQNTKRCE